MTAPTPPSRRTRAFLVGSPWRCASVASSPNPRRIRPYQPRRCSSQGLVLSRPYSSLSMKGAEKHRFPAVRAVEERTTSAGWRHDISRFSDLLLCPPVRRDIPCCSRTDLTADGSGFRSDARTRLRLRLATRASTKGRSREVPSAWERATCPSRAAAAVQHDRPARVPLVLGEEGCANG